MTVIFKKNVPNKLYYYTVEKKYKLHGNGDPVLFCSECVEEMYENGYKELDNYPKEKDFIKWIFCSVGTWEKLTGKCERCKKELFEKEGESNDS